MEWLKDRYRESLTIVSCLVSAMVRGTSINFKHLNFDILVGHNIQMLKIVGNFIISISENCWCRFNMEKINILDLRYSFDLQIICKVSSQNNITYDFDLCKFSWWLNHYSVEIWFDYMIDRSHKCAPKKQIINQSIC